MNQQKGGNDFNNLQAALSSQRIAVASCAEASWLLALPWNSQATKVTKACVISPYFT